jgi:glycosyltransferase involved in cell wall biosynthesis
MPKEEINTLRNLKPIIFWYGFPVCALLLKKVVAELGNNIIICGTKTETVYQNLEKMLEHNIIWFNNPNDIWERRNEFSDRNLIMHSGWSFPGWLKYDRLMRSQNKAKIVVMADNRYKGNLRQKLGSIWFRLVLKKYFDAVLVPGIEGKKLMRFLGMNESKIFTGLYGAYEGIYKETNPIEKRNKEFLFVGQIIKRKAVDVLIKAFNQYKQKGGTWNLRIIGNGPLENICYGEGIIYEKFLQPHIIAQRMNNARVLILPSRDDNWGTVVCEAAACGMHLITSKNVGASADIVKNDVNGIIIEKINENDIQKAFFVYERLPEIKLKEGSKISKVIAHQYNSEAFFNVFVKIIDTLL